MSNFRVYVDGGIGDFFVAESAFPEVPTDIYWQCRARPSCQKLMEHLWPHIVHHNHWEGILDEEHAQYTPHPGCPPGVQNYWVGQIFPKIRNGSLTMRTSSFLTNKMSDKIFDYGKPHYFIHHATPFNAPEHRRWLEPHEWEWIADKLEEEDAVGVCCNSADAAVPFRQERVINRVGTTTLGESIEVLKQSVGYIGIDSCMAALACQWFPADKLHIKADNGWYLSNRDCYCYPHTEYPFVTKELAPRKGIHIAMRTFNLKKPPMTVKLLKGRIVGNEYHSAGSLLELSYEQAQSWIACSCAERYVNMDESRVPELPQPTPFPTDTMPKGRMCDPVDMIERAIEEPVLERAVKKRVRKQAAAPK